jgi:hypothetical protein
MNSSTAAPTDAKPWRVSGITTLDSYWPDPKFKYEKVLPAISLAGLDDDLELVLRSAPVKVEGVFRSRSKLLIVSIPIPVWDLLPESHAITFIGFIESDNLKSGDQEKFQHMFGQADSEFGPSLSVQQPVSIVHSLPALSIGYTKPAQANEMPAISADQMKELLPSNFGFLWSIDDVSLTHDGSYQPRYLKPYGSFQNDNVSFWMPPVRTSQFRRTAGNIYRWRLGESSLITGKETLGMEVYSTVSMFYQARQDNFLVARVDCTRDAQLNGWSQTRFKNKLNNISEVGFFGAKLGLSASAKGSTWMPQLLPQVYDHRARDTGKHRLDTQDGGLCGDLPILFAMAAYSAKVEDAEAVIAECFKLGGWVPHAAELGIGRKSYFTMY